MEDRSQHFSGRIERTELVVDSRRVVPAVNSRAVLWTAAVMLGLLFALPLLVLVAWSLLPVGMLGFFFLAFVIFPPLAIGNSSRILDIRQSPTGQFIERCWKPVLSFLCRVGIEGYELETTVVERRTHIPVELSITGSANTPQLTWRWDHDNASVISQAALPFPTEPQMRPDQAPSGALDLEEGRLALELFRDPHLPDEVLLEARHTRSGARLTLRLRNPAWLSASDRAALPALEREGVEVSQEAQEALVSALVEIALLQGAHLPVELAKVAHTVPIYV